MSDIDSLNKKDSSTCQVKTSLLLHFVIFLNENSILRWLLLNIKSAVAMSECVSDLVLSLCIYFVSLQHPVKMLFGTGVRLLR